MTSKRNIVKGKKKRFVNNKSEQKLQGDLKQKQPGTNSYVCFYSAGGQGVKNVGEFTCIKKEP